MGIANRENGNPRQYIGDVLAQSSIMIKNAQFAVFPVATTAEVVKGIPGMTKMKEESSSKMH